MAVGKCATQGLCKGGGWRGSDGHFPAPVWRDNKTAAYTLMDRYRNICKYAVCERVESIKHNYIVSESCTQHTATFTSGAPL